nr:hypothetical protein [Tanacetum cinerariifolium]
MVRSKSETVWPEEDSKAKVTNHRANGNPGMGCPTTCSSLQEHHEPWSKRREDGTLMLRVEHLHWALFIYINAPGTSYSAVAQFRGVTDWYLEPSNAPGTSYSAVAQFGGVTDWYLEPRLAMSSDNAQSAVTYTSISSDSDGPSWGIPLMNAGEFLEMDPYEDVSQQGKVHLLSPTYILDPMELDEHAPEDPEEDPSEEHEPEDDDKDPKEDPNEEHESKGSDETEPFKEDKIAVTPPPSRH